MGKRTRVSLVVVALLGAAVGLRFGLAPILHELPPDYRAETRFESEGSFREAPEDPLQSVPQTAVRVDETLLTSGRARIVQSSTSWFTLDGALTYESTGLFAVDRQSRANVPDLGDASREGQFLFPPHVGRGSFTIWDAYYVGPRRANFVREDVLEGLPVLVFDIIADKINDTVAYEFLPSVPERYQVRTSGRTTVWVEPVSGLVVDINDDGKSVFVDPDDATPIATIAAWRTKYVKGERERLVSEARAERVKLLTVERWLPFGALAGAAVALVLGMRSPRRMSLGAGVAA